MSNELANLQNELTIERQKTQIMKLQYELQEVQAKKASRLDDSLFAPALYQHYQNVAVTLSKSGVIPNSYRGKPEDIFVAMAMGYQLGFPVEQSLQDIAVINGRPCLWGDGLLSLALNHPECESITEEPIMRNGAVYGFTCEVCRKGHDAHIQQFTMADAERAGLLKKQGPWQQFPARMLQMRARSFAIRDKFADALRGLRIAEIEEDDKSFIEGEFNRENDKPQHTQTQKLKARLGIKEQEDEAIYTDVQQNTNEVSTVVDNAPAKANSKASPVTQKIEAGEDAIRVHNTGSDDEPITDEQLQEIQQLLEKKGFDESRLKKALEYFKVSKLENLSDAKARLFMLKLG